MKEKKKLLPLLPAYANGTEMLFIKDAIRTEASGHSGRHVRNFTEELGKYFGVKGLRLVSNAPSALHLVCRLFGVEKGDIIFCSASMSIELAEPVLEIGAELVLIDSEMESWNMSPSTLQRALQRAARIGKLPKFVIVSHDYGIPAKIEEICSICKSFKVMVIEDCCEALGSSYRGKLCGTWGDFGIFSFDSDKVITTSAGGLLVSSHFDQLGEELHKAFLCYPTTEMGYTYSMNNILAGMGRAQLLELQTRITNKRKIYKLYKRILDSIDGVRFSSELDGSMPNRWLTTFLVNEKEIDFHAGQLVMELEKMNIEATLLKKPLHLYLSFDHSRMFSDRSGKSVSELLYIQGIGLPSGSYMSPEDQFSAIVAFRQAYRKIYTG